MANRLTILMIILAAALIFFIFVLFFLPSKSNVKKTEPDFVTGKNPDDRFPDPNTYSINEYKKTNKDKILEDFSRDNINFIRTNKNKESIISISLDNKSYDSKQSLKYHYDLRGDKPWVEIDIDSNWNLEGYSYLNLIVNSSAKFALLKIVLVDSEGELWYIDTTTLDQEGWKLVRIPLDKLKKAEWVTGPYNGKQDFENVQQYQIHVHESFEVSGTFYIDKIFAN